jgi:hypothetical protein
MGFQIVQNLGERYIVQSGILMSHHAEGGAEGQIGGQGSSQLKQRLGLWERRLKDMDEQTVRRTNGKQTLASYQAAYDHELWVTGAEAVEQGYADKVMTVRCDSSLDGYTTHTIYFMGIPIDYDLAKCPLYASPVNIRVRINTNKGSMTLVKFTELGGTLGSTCLADQNKICATDTTLTLEKLNEAKAKFIDHFTNVKNYVVPMTIK